ncbi:MAG TPA: hypothetical protein VK973_03605 [Arenicellales bacterium]|nr:hypothetical protein [Arenicellales bacterium]
MFKTLFSTIAVAAALTAAGPANAADPGGNYKKVSTLVELPEFIPGMGTLYVQPDTLPAGPFLAYDADDKLVSTIYMVPLADMQAEKKFSGLAVGEDSVEQVDMYYNAGHPGVDQPHYHIVLWHVSPEMAQLEQ